MVYPTWMTIDMITHTRCDERDGLHSMSENQCDAPKRGEIFFSTQQEGKDFASDLVQRKSRTTDMVHLKDYMPPPPNMQQYNYFNA